MKLRFGKNSVRLRVLRSEVEVLQAGRRLEETLNFGTDESAKLTYALEQSVDSKITSLEFNGKELVVRIPADRMQHWASSEQVGIYDQLHTGLGRTVDVLVEKDFACLDRSDTDNADTFVNPSSVC